VYLRTREVVIIDAEAMDLAFGSIPDQPGAGHRVSSG
jgi:hypothetical protein